MVWNPPPRGPVEVPPFPDGLGQPPDPFDRADYFRWAEDVRQAWLASGVSYAVAHMAWAALVAARLRATSDWPDTRGALGNAAFVLMVDGVRLRLKPMFRTGYHRRLRDPTLVARMHHEAAWAPVVRRRADP